MEPALIIAKPDTAMGQPGLRRIKTRRVLPGGTGRHQRHAERPGRVPVAIPQPGLGAGNLQPDLAQGGAQILPHQRQAKHGHPIQKGVFQRLVHLARIGRPDGHRHPGPMQTFHHIPAGKTASRHHHGPCTKYHAPLVPGWNLFQYSRLAGSRGSHSPVNGHSARAVVSIRQRVSACRRQPRCFQAFGMSQASAADLIGRRS
ncbi:hypothetical protein [Rhodobacter capsulatus]|uniref:hypothetical protein n=1 Tax=Rhodobacter capsulatus TaxID=1061 RepID=UPI00146BCCB7|nr:hypothetical protein [Rhodobacter capsulatus]